MSVLRSIACAGFIVIAAVACSSESSVADQSIRDDYWRYLTQLTTITDIEAQGNEANKKAVNAPGANDATYGVALRETILPKFESFERELSRIHPTTDEILGLHTILLKRTRIEVAGYQGLEEATRGGGEAVIQRANDLFAERNIYYTRWANQMDELNKRYPSAK